MKKFKIKLLTIICLVVSICFFTLFMCSVSKAEEQLRVSDSGHGTSYHGGGSHHSSSHSSSSSRSSSRSSSSSSYSGSSSHSGGGSSVSPGFMVVILLMAFSPFLISIILSIIFSAAARRSTNTRIANLYKNPDDSYLVNKITKVLPNFDRKEFLDNGYKIYVDVQNAWMNFKLDDVKNVITDEMYNMYSAQLDIMQAKGEQNIMSGFKECEASIKNVTIQNGTIAVATTYVVEFYDYVIDQKKGKVLRGSKSKKLRITYELTFRKNIDENAVIDNCPNCGAKLEDVNGAGTCKYCGSKLVLDNSNWILTNKKNLYQMWA